MLQKYFNIFICFIFPPPLPSTLPPFSSRKFRRIIVFDFFFLPQLFSYFAAVFFVSTFVEVKIYLIPYLTLKMWDIFITLSVSTCQLVLNCLA